MGRPKGAKNRKKVLVLEPLSNTYNSGMDKTANITNEDVAAELARLGAELQQVANDEIASKNKLLEIEKVLGALKVSDFPDLAESPIIESFVNLFAKNANLGPGEVKNKGTLAEITRDWSWRDLDKFEKIKFQPSETIPVTYNGLTIYLIADEMCEVPEPFYRIYQEHRKAIQQKEIHERWRLGQSTQAPDGNWQTDEGAMVRAWTMQGKGHLGVGTIITEDVSGGAEQ